MTYRPHPIDTSRFALDDNLQRLAAVLARNFHELGAGRLGPDGWADGPYDQLPDDKRQLALDLAAETLRAMLAAGYTLQPPVGGGAGAAASSKAVEPRGMTLSQPLDLWRSWDHEHVQAYVNRAARLEGMTPENEVYASQAFAAISYIEGAKGFTCEYMGEEVMPKKFGTFPTYLVRPFVPERQGA